MDRKQCSAHKAGLPEMQPPVPLEFEAQKQANENRDNGIKRAKFIRIWE